MFGCFYTMSRSSDLFICTITDAYRIVTGITLKFEIRESTQNFSMVLGLDFAGAESRASWLYIISG